jgi:hypothetical protein
MAGLEEQTRRSMSCPRLTDPVVAAQIVVLREKHPNWGLKKLLDELGRRDPEGALPSIPTAARILH